MLREPFLSQAAKEGYLTFSVWKEWYNNSGLREEVYEHSEILRKIDCMYRYRGTYDYAFPLDTDDFFNPRNTEMTGLKDYIKAYCYIKPAASCKFTWLWYFPKVCGMNGTVGSDGNVTHHLKSHKLDHHGLHRLKSVHNTNALVDSTFHSADCKGCLMPGYKAVLVPTHVAYVAHNRMTTNHDPRKVC